MYRRVVFDIGEEGSDEEGSPRTHKKANADQSTGLTARYSEESERGERPPGYST
jgi:hypothetical protein